MSRPTTLVLTIRDGKSAESQILLNVEDGGEDITNQIAAAIEAQELIDTIIGGAIVRCGLIVDIDLSGAIKTIPDVDSDIEEGAVFIWRSSSGHNTKARIPTFLESLITSPLQHADLTDGDVAAFNDMVIDGVSGIDFVDSRGDDVTSLLSANENFVKSRL